MIKRGMRRASPYSKLGGVILREVLELGKVQSELAKVSAFPVAAPVIGRACLDHRVTGGRLSSWRAWPLRAEGRGREGGWGEETICELAPFEIANASLPVPRIIAEQPAAASRSSAAVSECHCGNLSSFKESLFVHRE